MEKTKRARKYGRKKTFNYINDNFSTTLNLYNIKTPMFLTLTVRTYIIPLTDDYIDDARYLQKHFSRFNIPMGSGKFMPNSISDIEFYIDKLKKNKPTSLTFKLSFIQSPPHLEWGEKLFKNVEWLVNEIHSQFYNISNDKFNFERCKLKDKKI
jgi:hypothetical protein